MRLHLPKARSRRVATSDADALIREARRLRQRRRAIAFVVVAIVGGVVAYFAIGNDGSSPQPGSASSANGRSDSVDVGRPLAWQESGVLGTSSFTASACPTQARCFAAGLGGWVAETADGGVHWTVARHAALFPRIDQIVCPTATHCLEIGSSIAAPDLAAAMPVKDGVAMSNDGGATWSRVRIPSLTLFGRVACPTTVICYATAGANGARAADQLAESTDAGQSWRLVGNALPGTDRFASMLACPTIGDCVAGGGPDGIVATNDGGVRWSIEKEPLGAGGMPGLSDITCLTPRHCVAVGIEPHPGYPAAVVTRDGGRTWVFAKTTFAPGTGVVASGGGFASVSCTAASQCTAVGSGLGPVIAKSTDGGESWLVLATPSIANDSQLTSMACGAASGCIAVGSTANAAGLIAGSTSHAAWVVRYEGLGTEWSSMACPAATRCVAVGGGSGYLAGAQLIESTDGGRTWRQLPVPTGASTLAAIACPSVSRCYATASVPSASTPGLFDAAIYRSDDGGRHWRRLDLPKARSILVLSAIACPTASLCVAVGATGANGNPHGDAALVTKDAGARWVIGRVPSVRYVLNGLTGVSCPTAARCYAGSDNGVIATTNGGRTWIREPGAGSMEAIACPTVMRCVAVASDTEAHHPIHITTDGGRYWRDVKVPQTAAGFTATACAAATCIVAGPTHPGVAIFETVDSARHWHVASRTVTGSAAALVRPGTDLASAACPTPRRCVVLAQYSGLARAR